jgi:hypothetical protein
MGQAKGKMGHGIANWADGIALKQSRQPGLRLGSEKKKKVGPVGLDRKEKDKG